MLRKKLKRKQTEKAIDGDVISLFLFGFNDLRFDKNWKLSESYFTT